MMLACIPFLLAFQAAAEAPTEVPRFEVREGSHVMVWHDQVVLRDLSLEKDGVPLGFQPDMVRFKESNGGYLIRGANKEANQLRFRATFALSYEPQIRSSVPPGEGIAQFLIGRQATTVSDLLIDPASGWALQAPDCLDLAFWQEGGPAELDIRLKQKAVLRMGKASSWLGDQTDAPLNALRERVAKDFSAREQAVSAELRQILESELPGELSIDAVSPSAARFADDQPLLANFRIASPNSDVRFDLVILHNPGIGPRDMRIDYASLGWEKPKRQRIAVRFPDGHCFGALKEGLEVTVPAQTWQVFVFRPPMPQGVMASSAGPLAELLTPWKWESSAPERAGTQAYRARYVCENVPKKGIWAIFSVAAGRTDPLRVTGVTDENGTSVAFVQDGPWFSFKLGPSESARRELSVLTRGRTTDPVDEE